VEHAKFLDTTTANSINRPHLLQSLYITGKWRNLKHSSYALIQARMYNWIVTTSKTNEKNLNIINRASTCTTLNKSESTLNKNEYSIATIYKKIKVLLSDNDFKRHVTAICLSLMQPRASQSESTNKKVYIIPGFCWMLLLFCCMCSSGCNPALPDSKILTKPNQLFKFI